MTAFLAGLAANAKARLLQGVERARFRLPRLRTVEGEAVEALRSAGAFMTHVDALGLPLDSTQSDVSALLADVEGKRKKSGDRKTFARVSSPEVIERFPRVIRLGLSDALLNVAEAYLRLPVRYRGVLARIDDADGQSGETRCWHVDNEDFRIVKAILYVTDVGPEDGPFEFLPRGVGPNRSEVRWTEGRVTDADMEALVPRSEWVACCGPAGTVVLVDTCSVWHRGRPPTRNERRALFYAYNSRHPLNPQYCEVMFSPGAFAAAQGNLSPRQRASIGLR